MKPTPCSSRTYRGMTAKDDRAWLMRLLLTVANLFLLVSIYIYTSRIQKGLIDYNSLNFTSIHYLLAARTYIHILPYTWLSSTY